MGLDMYLIASRYVSGWNHSKKSEKDAFAAIMEAAGMGDFKCEGSPSLDVKVTVAYWRKANAVHGWFVRECQGGVDECQESDYISREKLTELRDLCQQVLDEPLRAKDLLPPTKGCFFGQYDTQSEWFKEDMKNTVEQLNKALLLPDDWEFTYRASW